MKKSNLKSILGAALVLSALANAKAELPKRSKKLNSSPNAIFKIKDKTDDQEIMSDGSKTEKASK